MQTTKNRLPPSSSQRSLKDPQRSHQGVTFCSLFPPPWEASLRNHWFFLPGSSQLLSGLLAPVLYFPMVTGTGFALGFYFPVGCGVNKEHFPEYCRDQGGWETVVNKEHFPEYCKDQGGWEAVVNKEHFPEYCKDQGGWEAVASTTGPLSFGQTYIRRSRIYSHLYLFPNYIYLATPLSIYKHPGCPRTPQGVPRSPQDPPRTPQESSENPG